MARSIGGSSVYTERLIKLIPSEIIAVYLAIDKIILTQPDIRQPVLIASSLFLAVLIPFYLWFLFGVKNKIQIIITMISFGVWVFSLGGPFLRFTWYLPVHGAIVLILWTVTVPIFKFHS